MHNKDEVLILTEIYSLVEEAEKDGTNLAFEIACSQIKGTLEVYFKETREEFECMTEKNLDE